MSRAGELVIALMCGLDRDHAIIRKALAEPAELAAGLLHGVKITKEDLLDGGGVGETFFAQSGIWPNLDKIVRLIRESGSEISGTDLCQKVVLNGKTALDYAIDKDALKEIFSPEIWKGDLPAMEKAWFLVPRGKRETSVFRQLRSAIATAAGRELREDALDRMGLSIFSLRSAVKDGNFKDVSKKFSDHGDHLRADDILMPDVYGDHMLDTRESWNNFEKLADALAANGERLEIRHFLHHHKDCKSPLEEALLVNQAKKIFSAGIWHGRMREMLELYEHVPVDRRKDVPLDEVLKELEEGIFSSRINIGPGLKKGDLTAIMNDAAHGDDAGLPAMRGLGLKKVWEGMADIRKILHKAGEAIVLDDLRLVSGSQKQSALITAAQCGRFDQVMDIVRECGAELGVDDLCSRVQGGRSVLDILAGQKQLDLVVRAELWAHRPQDFKKLWAAIPEKGKDQLNYQDLISRMNLIELHRRFSAPATPLPPAPAP